MTTEIRLLWLKIMEKPDAVQEWRSRQDDPDVLNHPRVVWEKFQKSSKQQDERDADKRKKRKTRARRHGSRKDDEDGDSDAVFTMVSNERACFLKAACYLQDKYGEQILDISEMLSGEHDLDEMLKNIPVSVSYRKK